METIKPFNVKLTKIEDGLEIVYNIPKVFKLENITGDVIALWKDKEGSHRQLESISGFNVTIYESNNKEEK
tara:strand:- start:5055 stop:5267 length:213 start_codon:yes stop_codon:yes gene_type:complete